MVHKLNDVLLICPFIPRRAKQCAGVFVMESSTYLDIPWNMGSECLTFGSDPINYRALHALCVVGPRITGTFLNLPKRSNDEELKYTGTYQLRYGHHILLGRRHETVFKIWYHLQ